MPGWNGNACYGGKNPTKAALLIFKPELLIRDIRVIRGFW